MDTIDEFASTLLEEAKRVLERAKEARGEMAEVPNLHAALLLSLCSLEAYVNASADAFSIRSDLSVHERGVLLERDAQLVNAEFQAREIVSVEKIETLVRRRDHRECRRNRLFASRVPSWAWPLILIIVTALFQLLRNLADKRHSDETSIVTQEG